MSASSIPIVPVVCDGLHVVRPTFSVRPLLACGVRYTRPQVFRLVSRSCPALTWACWTHVGCTSAGVHSHSSYRPAGRSCSRRCVSAAVAPHRWRRSILSCAHQRLFSLVPSPLSCPSTMTSGLSGADSGLSPHLRRSLGSTGIDVSPLGFGASPLGGVFGDVDVCSAAGPRNGSGEGPALTAGCQRHQRAMSGISLVCLPLTCTSILTSLLSM